MSKAEIYYVPFLPDRTISTDLVRGNGAPAGRLVVKFGEHKATLTKDERAQHRRRQSVTREVAERYFGREWVAQTLECGYSDFYSN